MGRFPTCSSPVRHVNPRRDHVRLACIRHAASVNPEPGSNSPPKSACRPTRKKRPDFVSRCACVILDPPAPPPASETTRLEPTRRSSIFGRPSGPARATDGTTLPLRPRLRPPATNLSMCSRCIDALEQKKTAPFGAGTAKLRRLASQPRSSLTIYKAEPSGLLLALNSARVSLC